jgi:hypothetical protein
LNPRHHLFGENLDRPLKAAEDRVIDSEPRQPGVVRIGERVSERVIRHAASPVCLDGHGGAGHRPVETGAVRTARTEGDMSEERSPRQPNGPDLSAIRIDEATLAGHGRFRRLGWVGAGLGALLLKAVGFSDRFVLGLVMTETMAVAAVGGGTGLALAKLFTLRGDPTGGLLPFFYLAPNVVAVGFSLALAVGVLSGILPALAAMRLRVVDAMRRV